jgi:hypothetical protein
MTPTDPWLALSLEHRRALEQARATLESQDFAARLADYAGQPITRALRLVPKAANDRINEVVQRAILNCLRVAIGSMEPRSMEPPANRMASVLAGISGGVSGFFGMAALPVELPLTTTLMLRSIADIARHHGEDLSTLEARLACIEVFALGTPKSGRRTDLGYYASRALLSRLAGDTSAALIERGIANLSGPAAGSLIAEVAARFGVVVSERTAASALPVLGAVGGATINVIFMNHFQRLARGHFTVRFLERQYGAALVRRVYEEVTPARSIAGA